MEKPTKIMKKLLILITIIAFTASCSSKTGKVGNIDPNDVTYFKDSRTNLCFALIGAKKGSDWANESTSIGMACVPCDNLKNVEIITK